MTYRPLTLALGGLAALALLALAGSDTGVLASHNTTGAQNMAIDADPTGNTATSLGARDPCVATTAGSDVIVDVTMTNIPVSNPMLGFNFIMTYDPAVLSVTAADTSSKLIASAPGSSAGYAGDESAVPDTDGAFSGVGYDTSIAPGSRETGSGVLERLTITVDAGAAPGGYALNLYDASHVGTATPTGTPAAAVFSAQVAVGVTCGSLTSTPAPNPTIIGDIDCGGSVNAVDALKILRYNASLAVVQTAPCTLIGVSTQANGSAPAPIHIGDVDCSGTVNSVDALKILRKNASLSVAQTDPCDDIGT